MLWAPLTAVRASADVTAAEPKHDLFGSGLSAAGELVPVPAIGEETVLAERRGARSRARCRRAIYSAPV